MPVSLPPQPLKKPTEADIERAILKGGSAPQLEDDKPVKHINVRFESEILRRIDALRSRRPRKQGSPKLGVSLRDWIAEAVLEKLKREER